MPTLFAADVMEDISVQVRWVYDWRFAPPWSIPAVTRPFTTCWLVLDGALRIWLDGRPCSFVSGDLLVCAPNRTLQARIRPEVVALRYLSFGGNLRLGGTDIVRLFEIPTVQQVDAQSRLTGAWEQLVREADGLLGKPGVDALPDRIKPPFRDETAKAASTARLRLAAAARTWLAELLDAVVDFSMTTTNTVPPFRAALGGGTPGRACRTLLALTHIGGNGYASTWRLAHRYRRGPYGSVACRYRKLSR